MPTRINRATTKVVFIGTSQVAALLGVSEVTARKRMDSGEIPSQRMANGRRIADQARVLAARES